LASEKKLNIEIKNVEMKVLALKWKLGDICRIQGLMDENCRTQG